MPKLTSSMTILIRSLLLSVAFALLVLALFGQEKPKSAESSHDTLRLVNAVDKPNCEYALAMLDGFVLTVMKDPSAIGHIVFYGGDDPVRNRYFEIFLTRYYVTHRLDRTRFHTYIGESGHEIKLELWAGNDGERPKIKEAKLTKDLIEDRQPIYFDGDLFEFYREQGKMNFVGLGCAACCLSSLDWSVLAEFLKANPRLKAYVIIRGKKSLRAAIRPFLTREVQDGGVPASRISLLDGGKNKLNDNKQFSEVEVFLSSRSGLKVTDFPSKFDSLD